MSLPMDGRSLLHRIPRQSRALKTFEDILEATSTLLIEVGYEGVNTNAIAAKAGVKPPAVYRYFPNKFALYFALANRLQRELHKELSSAISADHSTLESLVGSIIDAAAGFWLRRPAFSALWHGEWAIEGDPSPAQIFADQTVERLIAASDRFRGLGPEQERLVLTVAMHMGIALIEVAVRGAPTDRPFLLAEAKRAVVAYLLPVQVPLR